MIFTPIPDHPLVGQLRVYLPLGSSPYKTPERDGNTILLSGERVRVESAWTRDYLPDSEPDLFFVESTETGETTHVIADDLLLMPW
jgi:hypothetical protein